MPELPEVEVSRLGIAPEIEGRTIAGAVVRNRDFRQPVPAGLGRMLAGLRVEAVLRRGKYLLLRCRRGEALAGHLLIHLGMSGSLRFVAAGAPAEAHDHVDLVFGGQALRLRDPRRFGLVLWQPGAAIDSHPLLASLGPEPLADGFDGGWLHRALASRRQAIKPAIMDSHLVVGVGNIYASESLFDARISPLRAANRLSKASCERLADSIRRTLAAAIAAGGSSVRDYVHSDGGAGCFQLQCAVYERAGEPCRGCGAPVRGIRQAGRATYYCPRCQR
jgi:formamidopyrimidine-DNA glycosylase